MKEKSGKIRRHLVAILVITLLAAPALPRAGANAAESTGWQDVSIAGLTQPVTDVAAVSGNSSRVAAIFQGLSPIYSTGDGGVSWWSWIPVPSSDHLRIEESNVTHGLFYCAEDTGALYRSPDGGVSWSVFSNVGAQTNDVACSAGAQMLAATGPLVTPLSASYSPTGAAWSATAGPGAEWLRCTGDPSAANTFYLSQSGFRTDQLFRCTAAGVTWTACGALPHAETVTSMAVVSHGPLLLGCDSTGAAPVYRSTNSGVAWQSSGTGLPAGTSVRDIATCRVAPYNCYLATSKGAFASYDGGTTWRDISGSLPTRDITTITASGGYGNTVYAGAQNGHIYKLEGLPAINGVTPPSGFAGDTVTITGDHFGNGSSSRLDFCGVTLGAASSYSWTDGEIKVAVPAAARTGQITVYTPAGASNPVNFTVNYVPTPSTTWYLAEGSTGSDERGGFETWVLVQNPTPDTVSAQVTYMTDSGKVEGPTLTLKPNSRQTVNVSDTLKNVWNVSTKVTSSAPIIVERAMYWGIPGVSRLAAHDSIGVNAPAKTWYLAEGSTGADARGSFETWILVQNPSDEKASVQLTYMTPGGSLRGQTRTVQANTRETFNVSDAVMDTWSVSTTVTSDVPVIAERAMYWNTPAVKRQAAHDSIGVTAAAPNWYLAEGCTGGDKRGNYETWILVQNPSQSTANVCLTYMLPRGPVAGPMTNLPPLSRQTFDVSLTAPSEFSVSTRVTSDTPVIAERSMYWDTPGNFHQAGHDSIGVSR